MYSVVWRELLKINFAKLHILNCQRVIFIRGAVYNVKLILNGVFKLAECSKYPDNSTIIAKHIFNFFKIAQDNWTAVYVAEDKHIEP